MLEGGLGFFITQLAPVICLSSLQCMCIIPSSQLVKTVLPVSGQLSRSLPFVTMVKAPGSLAFRPRALKVIRVGSDFCGLHSADVAMGKLIEPNRFVIKFGCDSLPASRKLAVCRRNKPEEFFDDILQRNLDDVPETDLYVWTPPCPDFSKAGKRQGVAVQRGRLLAMGVRYIAKKKPRAWVFENVKGLLDKKFRKTWLGVKKTLKGVGYSVYLKVLKTSSMGPHSLPHDRERIYMVGIKNVVRPFQWPADYKNDLTLEGILDPFNATTDKPGRFPQTPKGAKELMKLACNEAMQIGVNPLKTPIAIDIDCSKRFRTWGNNVCKTLTKARGKSGGPWISSRGRRTTLKELMKIQGFAEGDIPWAQAGLTSPQVAAMLGDAVSINVLGPVIAEALYSSGLVKDKPKFPRDRAAVSASSSSSLT